MHCLNCYRVKLNSPIGELCVEACSKGIHEIRHAADDDMNFSPDLSIGVEAMEDDLECIPNMHLELCVTWLNLYFTNTRDEEMMLDVPDLCFSKWAGKGSFKERVWLTLAENVGPGETISYGKLALLAGSPGAAQAVGTAMALNPMLLMVPCHRVIRNDNSMGNYSSGKKNKIKEWLLKFEGVGVNEKGFVEKSL